MIVMTNVYFWKICNICKHIWPCILTIFLKLGENSDHNVKSLMMILTFSSLASFIPPSIVALTSLLWRWQTPAITILEPVLVQCDHQFSPSDNYWQLVIARLLDNEQYSYKETSLSVHQFLNSLFFAFVSIPMVYFQI